MPAYLPILKNKQAEFWAWEHASQTVLDNSRVLFELIPATDANTFAQKVARYRPPGTVPSVDSHALVLPNHAILQIAQALYQRDIPERPVMRIGDPPSVLAEVAAACAMHDEGACLRLGAEEEDPDPAVPASHVAAMVASVGIPVSSIDLVIDFWEINSARNINRCVPIAADMLNWASATGPWRSVTLASGAFPESISTLPTGTITPVHRYDAEFFAQVCAAGPEVQPDYGDYGINHPAIQPPVPRAPKPNLRYANGAVWHVVREDRILPGNESFFTACDRLVQSGLWAGATYSAGDAEIGRCSQSTGGAGAATQWIQSGASHHVAHVVDRLANLGVP